MCSRAGARRHPLRVAVTDRSATTVAVLVDEGSVDQVRHGLEAAVRMPRKATAVQIDNVMPLSYDWQMGAAHWAKDKREQIGQWSAQPHAGRRFDQRFQERFGSGVLAAAEQADPLLVRGAVRAGSPSSTSCR
jgi:hypothetical protein